MKVLSVASRYSEQPEENVITISRIGDASCPRCYYKNYVETPREAKPFESIELGMGQFFHNFLQWHFNRILAEQRVIDPDDRIDPDDLLRRFRLSFIWEGKLREPYRIVRRTYTLDDFQDRLTAVGRHFNKLIWTELLGHRIESIEGELQIRTDACYIRGKHDLITTAPYGGLVLWDWKTGRKPKPEYFDQYESLKAQLGVYATWMRYIHKSKDVMGTAVFLRDSLEEQSEKFTPAIEQDVLEYMAGWRSRLNGMKSYPPIPSQLCDWCSWNETCPAMKREIKVAAPKAEERPRQSRRCFVASAAFGDQECEELVILRRFRDTRLARYSLGRVLVNFYYDVGPAVARYVKRHSWVRAVVRRVVGVKLSANR